MNEQHEKIYTLMSRKLAEEASAEELEELDALLAEHPELQYAFSMVTELSPLPKPTDPPTADELERKNRGAARIQRLFDEEAAAVPVRRLKPRWPWMAAASVVLLAGVAAVWALRGKNSPEQVVVETRFGPKQQEVQLPDGTTVTLNAGSKLVYDEVALAAGKREVRLEGEGFFKVKADEQHPFIIKTGKVDVRVLGTTFNLKAYPEDNRVETFLISGRVEVAYEENGRKTRMQLRPSERFIVSLPAVEIRGNTPPPPPVLKSAAPDEMRAAVMEPGWLTGRLELENVTFEQLVNELERWYDVKITIKNEQLKAEIFTGTFDSKSLPEVLEALQYTLQFKYSIDENRKTVELW